VWGMRALPGLAIGLATGCAAIHRPPATVATLGAESGAAAAAHRALVDSVIQRLVRRVVQRGDQTLDLLLLSGGGQHGAYGGGFLRGWRARPDSSMPRFDLVSGISAGALEAPFALLGTQAALDTLTALYERAAASFAPTVDWWFWLRRTGGVVNVSRYTRTLAAVMDTTMASRLRHEFEVGRQLLIGTTDMDLGIGRVWDFAREFNGTAPGLARGLTLLKASSAIPAVFPPVVIDGHVHSDGGIVSNVVPVLDLDAYRRLALALRERGITGAVTIRVWTIMNLFAYGPVSVTDPASRGKIGQRAGLLLFLTKNPQLHEYLATLARAVSTDVPGLRMEVRVTSVPAELLGQPGANALFDRGWMRRLLDVGYARAQSALPWDSVPGPYSRPATRTERPDRR